MSSLFHGISLLQVVGKGVLGSVGIVMSINEQEGIATVKFPSCEYRRTCKASDILTVPISRLCTPRSEVLLCSTFNTDFIFVRDCCFNSLCLSLFLPPSLDRRFLFISSQSQRRSFKQCSLCFCHRRAVSQFTPLYQLQEMAPAQLWLQCVFWRKSGPGTYMKTKSTYPERLD